MFTNRHINFAFFSVILVVFAIAISASCKLAYAQPAHKPKMVITIDANTGAVESVVAAGTNVSGTTGAPAVGTAKKVIPAVIITHKKNPNCITFFIAGTYYTYCF